MPYIVTCPFCAVSLDLCEELMGGLLFTIAAQNEEEGKKEEKTRQYGNNIVKTTNTCTIHCVKFIQGYSRSTKAVFSHLFEP